METLSVVISAWNEEKKISVCLDSVQWANELIVVDNSSTDATAAIAKQYKAKVYRQTNNVMLNVNKNYGFSKATGSWILSLDADEQIPTDLAREIKQIITKKDAADGYWIARKNIIFGKWIQHGLWWPDKQLRLFRKDKGKFPCKHVHEYVEIEGPTGELVIPYIHNNYETISQFLRKMDTIYTESEVQKLLAMHYQLSWHDAIRFPLSDFVKIYFAEDGYKDGLHGLVLSMLQAFYSFIVFAKLWEHDKFVERDLAMPAVDEELRHAGSEMRYWMLTRRIKHATGPIEKLLLKTIRRCTKPQ